MAWTGVLLSAVLEVFNRYTKVSFHSASLAELLGLSVTLYGRKRHFDICVGSRGAERCTGARKN